MKRKRVYIAGPYSARSAMTVFANMRKGIKVAHKLLKAGFAVWAPWLDYQYFLAGDGLGSQDYWENGLAWLEVSDAFLLVEGWEYSTGATSEKETAEKLGIPVFYDAESLVKWRDKEAKKLLAKKS